MNLAELAATLTQSSLPEDAYSLTGGFPNEAYCIEQSSNGEWHCYYSERGLRTGLTTFATEEEACEYFFNEYVRD